MPNWATLFAKESGYLGGWVPREVGTQEREPAPALHVLRGQQSAMPF